MLFFPQVRIHQLDLFTIASKQTPRLITSHHDHPYCVGLCQHVLPLGFPMLGFPLSTQKGLLKKTLIRSCLFLFLRLTKGLLQAWNKLQILSHGSHDPALPTSLVPLLPSPCMLIQAQPRWFLNYSSILEENGLWVFFPALPSAKKTLSWQLLTVIPHHLGFCTNTTSSKKMSLNTFSPLLTFSLTFCTDDYRNYLFFFPPCLLPKKSLTSTRILYMLLLWVPGLKQYPLHSKHSVFVQWINKWREYTLSKMGSTFKITLTCNIYHAFLIHLYVS